MDAVCVLSARFLSNLQNIFKTVQRLILWNLKEIRLLLFEKCNFLKFNWTRFLFYRSNFCQIRTWPSLYNIQKSCQISLKSVKNFLSYLDHRLKDWKADSHELLLFCLFLFFSFFFFFCSHPGNHLPGKSAFSLRRVSQLKQIKQTKPWTIYFTGP